MRSRRVEVDAAAAFQAWATVSRAMLEDREPGEMLDLIASTAASLTGMPFSAVLLVTDDGSKLEIRGSYGLSVSYVERLNHEVPLMLDANAAARDTAGRRAYTTGRPTVLHFDSEDGLWPWSALAEEQGYVSLASAPLASPGRQLGALNVYAREHTEFSHSQITLLEALATEAAAAIEIMEMRAVQRATIQELEQSDRIQQVLATVALADEGLEPITGTLAKLMGQGVAVEDSTTGRTLSQNGLTDSAMEALDAARKQLKSAQHVGSLGRADVRVEPDLLVALEPVSLGAETVAYLWAVSSGVEAKRRVLERGAVIVALELLKQRDARAAEWRVRGEVLDELMAASLDDQDRVFERARALGHELEDHHAPIVVRPDAPLARSEEAGGHGSGSHALRRIVAIIYAVAAEHARKPLVGTVAGAVVFLWPADGRPPNEIADSVRRYVSSRTSETVSVCVGERGSTLPEYTQSIRLAMSAIRLMQSSGTRDRVLLLEELGIFRVLLSVNDEDLLKDTAHRVLGQLLEYDSARNSTMLETLTAVIDADLNVAEAARVLHLHPNSLYYRIRRIEELLGVKLSSPQDLIHVGFALAILRLYPTDSS